MNRCPAIDSDKSLDQRECAGDAVAMSRHSYHLHIHRVDTARNMARYYRLAIEPTLFGNICLVRNWGRIGTHGQQQLHFFDDEKQALRLFLEILKAKRRKGYRPMPNPAKL